MSLRDEISKGDIAIYKPLTRELLEETLNKLIERTPIKNDLVIFTGYLGMFIHSLKMVGINGHMSLRWGFETHKRIGQTWFWFGIKSGAVKGKMNRSTHLIDVYDSTQYKFSTKDFKDIENYINGKTKC